MVLFAFLFAFLFSYCVLAQPTPNTEVWFHPNSGSVDLLNLFNNPEQWPTSRAIVDVFGFYINQVLPPHPQYPCTVCGQNILPNLINAQAFSKLSQWNKKIAVEVFAVKHFSCANPSPYLTGPELNANSAQVAINSIQNNGGTVEYLIMDEPLIGGWQTINGQTCGYTIQQTAQDVAQYINLVHAQFPNIKIGTVEAYPDPAMQTYPQAYNPSVGTTSVTRIQNYILELEQQGVQLPFFHLDVNSQAIQVYGANFNADLIALKNFFANRPYQIDFGVIFNENINYQAQTNQQYYTATLSFLNNVNSIIGVTQDEIFQSWHDYNDPLKQLPSNLPETTAYVHTNLIVDGWQALGGTLPDTTPPSIPGSYYGSAISQSSVQLAWGAAMDNVGVTGYLVDVSTSASFANYVSGWQGNNVGNILSNTISNLNPGTTYYSRVRAMDAAGNTGAYITATPINTLQQTIPLQLPTLPLFTNITYDHTTNFISLIWADSLYEQEYVLERSQENNPFVSIANLSADTTSYQDVSVSQNKNYLYRISAVNSAGVSAYSFGGITTIATVNYPTNTQPTTAQTQSTGSTTWPQSNSLLINQTSINSSGALRISPYRTYLWIGALAFVLLALIIVLVKMFRRKRNSNEIN